MWIRLKLVEAAFTAKSIDLAIVSVSVLGVFGNGHAADGIAKAGWLGIHGEKSGNPLLGVGRTKDTIAIAYHDPSE